MILYRPMVDGDVPAGLSLCRAANWNQTVEDWQLFLKLSPRGCFVAVDDYGEVRGTVTTVRYENRFSWIGMVLVDPAYRRKGIGIQLVREAIHLLREDQVIKLDATSAGRHVYAQLDFVDEYPITRMEAKGLPPLGSPADSAQRVQLNNMRSILEMDRQVFGADREQVLNPIFSRSPQYAFFTEGREGIKSYCFGRPGHNFSHIGPVIASDLESAKHVVIAALQNTQGRPVVIDALQHDPLWMEWLTTIGFTEQRPLIRMYRGKNDWPGIPERQFAILGPEFG